ncbi:MAG: P-loop NTPase [Desulfobacterales bacterium]|nr:P-loop NTPase [Desulfobacterales bacterium]
MQGIEEVKRIIAIASGKGGVGKSTVTVNLAIALSKKGFKVGILDADMHGPDIPIMLGIDERPLGSKGMLLPIEKFGLKVVSTGTLAGEGVPIVWRGPLVTKAIKEFLGHVAWGKLDYLLVDLPPGTGDAPLTMAKLVSLDGVIIVTTPQKVALADVRRCIGLFVGQDIPIFGVVENMSFLRVPGVSEEQILEVFGSGGGEKIAKAFKVPLLGKVPLDQKIREGGDAGKPMTLDADSECAKTFDSIAEELLEHIRK